MQPTANAVSIQRNAEKTSSSYLLDFGHVTDEGIVVHVVVETSQLVQVPDEVLANPLFQKHMLKMLNFMFCSLWSW